MTFKGGRVLSDIEGMQLPLPAYPALPHRAVISETVRFVEPGGVHGVRGVVFDGERIGFTNHDNRGWISQALGANATKSQQMPLNGRPMRH